MRFNPQQTKIYDLLDSRGELGVKCYEFPSLLYITQQNARINEMRKILGCTCKNSRGRVKYDCQAKEHLVNDGGTTYLVKPQLYQASFI